PVPDDDPVRAHDLDEPDGSTLSASGPDAPSATLPERCSTAAPSRLASPMTVPVTRATRWFSRTPASSSSSFSRRSSALVVATQYPAANPTAIPSLNFMPSRLPDPRHRHARRRAPGTDRLV